MASAGADSLEERNRKVGGLLLGVILALIAIAIIGVLTLN
jgi:hypothetical protein